MLALRSYSRVFPGIITLETSPCREDSEEHKPCIIAPSCLILYSPYGSHKPPLCLSKETRKIPSFIITKYIS